MTSDNIGCWLFAAAAQSSTFTHTTTEICASGTLIDIQQGIMITAENPIESCVGSRWYLLERNTQNFWRQGARSAERPYPDVGSLSQEKGPPVGYTLFEQVYLLNKNKFCWYGPSTHSYLKLAIR